MSNNTNNLFCNLGTYNSPRSMSLICILYFKNKNTYQPTYLSKYRGRHNIVNEKYYHNTYIWDMYNILVDIKQYFYKTSKTP